MSDKITKSPQIRFAGFTEAWEQRKAEEIFKTVSDKGHPELPVLSASQQLGMVRRDENGIDIQYDIKSVVNYKRVLPKQFVIHLRSFQGGFAHSSIEGITSPAYTIIDFKSETIQSDLFWNEIFTSKRFIKKLETVTYGVRDGRSISFNDFKTLWFTLPSYLEQDQIAEFFNGINNLITLHQRKWELLKDTKKILLQKMFPKDGADVPEIRFAGFTDAWEQRKVSEITLFHKQGFYTTEEYDNSKKYYLLRGTDLTENRLQLKDTPKINASEKEYKDFKAQKGDFLIVRSGTVGTYGIVYEDIEAIFGSYLINFRFDKNSVTNEFFGYFYQSELCKAQLRRIIQQSANTNINAENIKSVIIYLPKVDEQRKISDLFSGIDQLITLHQRELNSLKNLKKSLLQQMIV